MGAAIDQKCGRMRKVLITCAALAAVAATALGAAVATLYNECVDCLDENAEKPYLGGKVPALNTLSKEDIIASLKGYKDGTLGDGKGKFGMMGLMKGQVASLNDEAIEAIADFIVSKK